ncbi:MAG: dienelactone hydrolase family protein [Cyanobacteria bacterium REEB67]|nr:dienelactone hydrolase family protein [Cyanobacteria bacterium REEB67]
MAGSKIDIKTSTGTGMTGYLALPEAPRGPGLLLVQEIFGVNSHIRDVADLYAAAGFVVLAPDAFWRQQPGVELGYTPEDVQKGMALAKQLDQAQVLQDMQSALATLRGLPQCGGKVGVVGYCFGGTMAYRLATSDAVDVAVGYYGGGIEASLDSAKNLHCPFMLHFGEKDAHITRASVEKIKDALKDKGHVEIFVYKDADHGFNCDQRASYNRFSAMLAYGRSYRFLKNALT